MDMDTRPGGCLPGLPLKLGLLGSTAPALPGDTLTVAADCAVYLSPELRPMVTACPRQDADPAGALRALLDANDFRRLRLFLPETPCCAALETAVRAAAGTADVETVRLPPPAAAAASTPPTEKTPIPARPAPAETRLTPLSRLRFYTASVFGGEELYAAASAPGFPTGEDQCAAAAALGRETVFVRPEQDGSLSMCAASPAGECQPSPPAVLAAAGVLRDRERGLWPGTYNVRTPAGYVQINVGEELVWIESGAGPLRRMLEEGERVSLRETLGLPDGETELRPCLAGTQPLALLEVPDRMTLASARPGEGLAACLTGLGAAGAVLFCRTGETETAVCRCLDRRGQALFPGAGAALLGWWLPLLRRAGAECVFREGAAEVRTFTGPDGRLFLGGKVSPAERPIAGAELR